MWKLRCVVVRFCCTVCPHLACQYSPCPPGQCTRVWHGAEPAGCAFLLKSRRARHLPSLEERRVCPSVSSQPSRKPGVTSQADRRTRAHPPSVRLSLCTEARLREYLLVTARFSLRRRCFVVSFVSPSQLTLVPSTRIHAHTHTHTLRSEKLLLSLVYCFQTLKCKLISEALTIP